MSADDDIITLDAVGQAQLVAKGEASPAELVDAAIARADERNPELNAIIHERYDAARAEAASPDLPHGPFRGVPMVVKDLDGFLAGEPYHAGSRFLRDRGYVATTDSELFRRFRQAGFVIIGKTNTPELGLTPSTEPLAYGPTRNPYDTSRSAGGSSGGSAAAVAVGIVPAGHAGDGGGSIRIPASCCGLVGLKPSRGRVSLGPHTGEAWGGLVSRLVVTRSVRDTAVILDAVAGPAPGDPYTAPTPARPYAEEVGSDPGPLRIGIRTEPGNGLATEPDCVEAAERAAHALEALGHRVEPAAPAALDDDLFLSLLSTFSTWVTRDLDVFAELTGDVVGPDDVEPGTWAIAEMGRSVTAAQYQAGLDQLSAYSRRMATWWSDDGFDLLLTPTLAEIPPTLGQFQATADNPLAGVTRGSMMAALTMPYNITGQPAISLPLHHTAAGVPVGVQLVAAYAREDVLLRVASQLLP